MTWDGVAKCIQYHLISSLNIYDIWKLHTLFLLRDSKVPYFQYASNSISWASKTITLDLTNGVKFIVLDLKQEMYLKRSWIIEPESIHFYKDLRRPTSSKTHPMLVYANNQSSQSLKKICTCRLWIQKDPSKYLLLSQVASSCSWSFMPSSFSGEALCEMHGVTSPSLLEDSERACPWNPWESASWPLWGIQSLSKA